jgi:hypothetical protein
MSVQARITGIPQHQGPKNGFPAVPAFFAALLFELFISQKDAMTQEMAS